MQIYPKIKILQATLAHEEIVLALAQAFHLEDGHPLAPTSAQALREALEGSVFAKVYLVQERTEVLGYFVLCYTLSIEFGGLVVILDDLFLKAEFRRKKIGAYVLQEMKKIAQEVRAVQIFLEVEQANAGARKFYESNGFKVRERSMMEFFPKY